LRRYLTKVVGLVAATGLVLAACGNDDGGSSATTTAPAPAPGTTTAITIALGSEPTSLDPHLVDDGGERAINDNIYETLLARDAQGDIVPGLAVEFPTEVDELTWAFTLRPGVTFHNGEPFNADSVVATVDRMVRLVDAGLTDNDGFFGNLAGATKVDDLTVHIVTKSPDGVLPSRMYWLKQIPASAVDSEDLSASPVGTGPYTFVSQSIGVSVVLAANPNYWGGAPSIGQVTYEFSEDSSTRLAGLKSGKYDLITNLAPQDVSSAPKFAAVQGQEHPIMILDVDDGITSDVRVRQALNLAVDKEAIAANIFGGYAEVEQCQLLSPSILGHNPALSAYPYDPAQAKALLEEAGVAGQSINLVGESGRWLKDKEVIEAVAGYWTAAGLNVQLDILEFGAYLGVLFDRENRADAIFVSSSNDILDPDRQLSTYYRAGGIGSSNTDATLAKLIEDARSELDPAARGALYQEAVQIACDGAYFTFLVNNQDLYGMSERLDFAPRVDSKLLVKEMTVAS
jgi:peptide/nickel transport system substrate-binding protein